MTAGKAHKLYKYNAYYELQGKIKNPETAGI
jgi:hypothetical protein